MNTQTIPRRFGTEFGRMMTRCDCLDGVWQTPSTGPLEPLRLHPGTHALHYASQGFEGMKAYAQPDGCVKIFRMDDHVLRLQRTAAGLHLPVPPVALIDAMIRVAVRENLETVPSPPGALYLRPTIIGSEANIGGVTRPSCDALLFVIVSPMVNYFSAGDGPLRLLIADKERAVEGIAAIKAGANYASALSPIERARTRVGADQVLFCPGGDVQETGTSNFILINDKELITKPVSSAFLPGIIRDSVLRLASTLGYAVQQTDFTVPTLLEFIKTGEAALTGTAAVVASVGELVMDDNIHSVNGSGSNVKRLREALTNIQFGHAEDRFNWLTACTADAP